VVLTEHLAAAEVDIVAADALPADLLRAQSRRQVRRAVGGSAL
jgi:hypothetical protein